MAGLGMYALAGALAGAGQGIVERARGLAEAAMQQQERADDIADMEREYELKREMKGMAPGKSGGGGGGGGGGGSSKPSAPKSSAPSAPKPPRLMGEYEKDGFMYGRTSDGVLRPYKDENGEMVPWSNGGRRGDKGEKGAKAAEPSDEPPAVDSGAPGAPVNPAKIGPTAGTIAEHDGVKYRFKGGENIQSNWEKVS